MAKSILFDLDGTITDSGEGIINCAIYAMEQFALPIPSREELRVFVGPPLHETFIRFGVPAERAEEAVAFYRERYLPIGMLRENKLYPGIEQVLQKLKADGHRLYVATSKPESMAVAILEYFKLSGYFDMICGATMDTSRTDKAAVIAYLRQTAGTQGETVMVGDTAFDVIGAAKHGIPTVGVSWGYGLVSDMEKAGATAIAHTMDELYTLLK